MLEIRAFAITCGLFLAGTVAVVGLVNMVVAPYGRAVLDLFASLYPGYAATGDAIDWLIGIVLAAIDGAIGGAVFAWLYNRIQRGALR